MSDDSSRERGGSAGSHLLHLISRNAPRVIGAAWVVAEAAARRVADVIQAVRAEAEPTRHEPESLKPEQKSPAAQAEPGRQPVPNEPKPKGQTATHKEKSSKKSARHTKPGRRAPAKAPAKKPSEQKQKTRNRTAKKSKS